MVDRAVKLTRECAVRAASEPKIDPGHPAFVDGFSPQQNLNF
jgi:hypothetical protein